MLERVSDQFIATLLLGSKVTVEYSLIIVKRSSSSGSRKRRDIRLAGVVEWTFTQWEEE